MKSESSHITQLTKKTIKNLPQLCGLCFQGTTGGSFVPPVHAVQRPSTLGFYAFQGQSCMFFDPILHKRIRPSVLPHQTTLSKYLSSSAGRAMMYPASSFWWKRLFEVGEDQSSTAAWTVTNCRHSGVGKSKISEHSGKVFDELVQI